MPEDWAMACSVGRGRAVWHMAAAFMVPAASSRFVSARPPTHRPTDWERRRRPSALLSAHPCRSSQTTRQGSGVRRRISGQPGCGKPFLATWTLTSLLREFIVRSLEFGYLQFWIDWCFFPVSLLRSCFVKSNHT